MLNSTYSICISKLGAILLLTCLMLTSCNQEEMRPFSMSEQAAEYSFSADNIISLKSVALDKEDTGNRFILEFNVFSKYISKESIEETLKAMEENPSNHKRRIIGESVDHVTNNEIQVMYSKNSIFIILHFDPNVECSQVVIKQGNLTVEISGPWDSPSLLVRDFSYVKDGAEGVLFRSQEYDGKNKKWSECTEVFAEDVAPVGV